MCTVEIIDGDKRHTRNVHFTSISPPETKRTQEQQTKTGATDGKTSIGAEELREMQEDIQELVVAMKKLQVRLNKTEELI